MKAASLQAVAQVLQGGGGGVEEGNNNNNNNAQTVVELRKKLFEAIGKANGAESTMAYSVYCLRAPIPVLRSGVYAVLAAAAK